jgi:hypothetical protein
MLKRAPHLKPVESDISSDGKEIRFGCDANAEEWGKPRFQLDAEKLPGRQQGIEEMAGVEAEGGDKEIVERSQVGAKLQPIFEILKEV